MTTTNTFPADVAAEVLRLRPALDCDDGHAAIRAVLTTDPTLTAEEAIEALDEAAELATADRKADTACESCRSYDATTERDGYAVCDGCAEAMDRGATIGNAYAG
ncbi:MAG TPA: hypothetical protein VEL28_06755 [Candidatus Binatia bacterium]|nr:hypothetical protein [Candidatus Binatia bacterium]